MRARLLAAAVIVAVAAALPATAAAAPAEEAGTVPSLERGVLAKINVLRVSHGLRRLAPSPSLRSAARMAGARMLAGGYFDHRSLRRITGLSAVGENLAWGAGRISADRVLTMWLQSPPHRRNLLSRSWRLAGIGVAYGPAGGVYRNRTVTVVVADFGTP